MRRFWIMARDRVAWFSVFAVCALVVAAVTLVLGVPLAWTILLVGAAVTCGVLGLRE